ncbi:AAA family ATPase [Sorangium sp. So ce375]|uniref:AAA family ATPase n=1 Tax=Sorangium sp. So ce375 TaxID=3133306 RepID=UPI003F5B8410
MSFGVNVLRKLIELAHERVSKDESVIRKKLRDHFALDPAALPIVEASFPEYDRPNVQVALDGMLEEGGRSHALLGLIGRGAYDRIRLGQLATATEAGLFEGGPSIGPVEYKTVDLDAGQKVSCLQCGLLLVHTPERLAVLVGGSDRPWDGGLTVSVMAPEREAGERFLAKLRQTMRERNVYRGKVVSLDQVDRGTIAVSFRPLREVGEGDLILPGDLLRRIERSTIRISEHARPLLSAGRHLKRGVLLHGPPGTGKTLTAMYLASRMEGRTVILLTGRSQGLIRQSCAMARFLQPATVVLEDVDLVAEDRTRPDQSCNGVLFELLNEMDGLGEDADVLFLLTTNRPDILEPALASRPGRVDLAVEVPLPDGEGRRRMFELYGRGLTLKGVDLPRWIARTEGASGAFIRELLRKAAVFAAEEGQEIVVDDRHLDDAIRELVLCGGGLTKSLLAAQKMTE